MKSRGDASGSGRRASNCTTHNGWCCWKRSADADHRAAIDALLTADERKTFASMLLLPHCADQSRRSGVQTVAAVLIGGATLGCSHPTTCRPGPTPVARNVAISSSITLN